MQAFLQKCLPVDHAIMEIVQLLYHLGGEIMDTVFLAITFLGEETFVILLIIAVYWCWNKRLGETLLFSLYTAMSVNGALKDLIRRPRPFLVQSFSDLRYVKVDTALVDTAGLSSSWSFPSGHSQTAGATFGALSYGKRSATKTLCGILIVLVMLSRVYLGVHYPTDTVAGALLGLVISAICCWLFEHFYKQKLLLLTLAVFLSCFSLMLDFSAGTLKTIGLGIGAILGIAIENASVKFPAARGVIRRVLRLVIGFAILMGIRLGLKPLLPDLMWCDALRYALMGFAGTYLWPWLFTKLGL